MANNNDWNRNRRGSGQDWDNDDYRNEQNYRQRYDSGYRGSGYENDRYNNENDRFRGDLYRDNDSSGWDWNRSSNSGNDYNRGRGSDYNRNSGSDYDRAYGRSGDYNRSNWGNDYNRSNWGNDSNRGNWSDRNEYRNRDRDWWDRTRDEVSSWFGDEEARNRRRMDEREGPHRGKGPKGYTRSDDRIKEDVNDRLNDDSRVDASDIEVSVSGCDVTLSGNVNSRDEKRRAEFLAEAVSGVKNVENRLHVNQESSWGTRGSSSGNSSTYSGSETAYTGTAASTGMKSSDSENNIRNR